MADQDKDEASHAHEPNRTEPLVQRKDSSEGSTTNVFNGPVYNAQYLNTGQAVSMGDYASSAQLARPEDSALSGRIAEDRRTLARIQQLLTYEGSMKFVEHNNFAGFSFENAEMHEIWNFLEATKDPKFEFLDEELEQSFGMLKRELARFADEVATNTFSTTAGSNSVPAEFETEYPDRFRQMVNDIHNAAKASTEAYTKFVRLSRRKLPSLEPTSKESETAASVAKDRLSDRNPSKGAPHNSKQDDLVFQALKGPNALDQPDQAQTKRQDLVPFPPIPSVPENSDKAILVGAIVAFLSGVMGNIVASALPPLAELPILPRISFTLIACILGVAGTYSLRRQLRSEIVKAVFPLTLTILSFVLLTGAFHLLPQHGSSQSPPVVNVSSTSSSTPKMPDKSGTPTETATPEIHLDPSKYPAYCSSEVDFDKEGNWMFTRALLEQKTDGSGQLLTHIWSHANNSVGHHGVSVVLLLGEGGERLWTSRARQLGVAGKAEIAARELAKKLGVTPIPLSVEESEWNRSDDFSDPIPREIMNLSQFVVIIQRNEKDVDKVSQWVASEAAKETLSDLKRSLQDPERRKVIPINDEP